MDSSKAPISADNDINFKITAFQQMGAACVGGVLSSFLITPLDVLKVRLQAQQRGLNIQYKYSGTWDAALKMTRFEGITSLWSGLLPTIILTVPATIIYFVMYDRLKSRLIIFSGIDSISPAHPPPPWISIVAGGTARMLSLTSVGPLELVRTKMQSEKLSYFQMNYAVRSLVRSHGVIGLWKGLTPTLLRSVPFAGIYWVIYEKLKSFSKGENISIAFSFVGGCISGAVAACMTNPFDVVKTLSQTDFANKQILPGKSKSIIQTLKIIYASKGILGLYSGLTPRLVKVIPQCAITVSTFEAGKKYFREQSLNRLQTINKDEKSGFSKLS